MPEIDRPRRPVGRPPRTDDPQKLFVTLPGKIRRWLKRRAGAEGRDQGGLVADALVLYQERVRQRRKMRRAKKGSWAR